MSYNLPTLEAMLQEFYASTTSNERKRAIEVKLIAFRNECNAWKLSLEALQQSANEVDDRMFLQPNHEMLWFFYASTLEHVIKRRWSLLSVSERTLLRETLWQIYVNIKTPVKLRRQRDIYATLLGLLGRRQFPDEDPNYVNHCLSLVNTKFTLGVRLLRATSEELVSNRGDLRSDCKQYFQSSFSRYLPDVMELLTRFLVVATCRVCGKELHSIPGFNNLIDPTLLWNSLPNDDQLQVSILELLSCLEHMVSWVPTEYISEFFLISILELSQWRPDLADMCVGSLSVLIELLCLQKPLPYPNTLMGGVNTLLEQHLNLIKQQDEIYLNKLTEFLRTYTQKYWSQISKEAHHPANVFLKTLYSATIIRNNPRNFVEKLQIWEPIIHDLSTFKDVRNYSDLLSQLLSEIMRRLHFQYNAEELLVLKEDARCIENIPSDDDDEENKFAEYVNHCLDCIYLVAIVSGPEVVFREVSSNWSKPFNTLQTLEASLHESNSQTLEKILKTCKFWQNLRDLSTSCQVIIRILPLLEETIVTAKTLTPPPLPLSSVCIPRNDAIQAIQILNGQLLQILKVLTTERFLHAIFNRKNLIIEYENLCSQSLTTIYVLLPLVMKIYTSSEIPPFLQEICVILGRIYDENTSIGTVSTQQTIYLIASKLLMRIAMTVHPPGLLEMPTINGLIRRGSCLMHLPIEVIANIYISVISYMILEQQQQQQQQQQCNVAIVGLREYIEYLAAGFLQIDAIHCTNSSDLDLSSNTLNLLAVFALVLDHFKTSNNSVKLLLANIFKPIINKILTLYNICSKDDDLVVAVNIAEFALSVLRSLQTQLGPTYIEEMITLFINNSHSKHLNTSRILMMEKILKMFQLIVEQPGNSSLALLPSILDFTIEHTMPLLQHDNHMDNTDLTSIIYSLLDSVMKYKWQYFYKNRVQPTVVDSSASNNNTYSMNSGDNLHPEHFLSIMNAYGHALVSDRDPNIVRNVLNSLQYINERWRLYQRAFFREHLLSSFQAATLNVLLSGEGSGSLHSDLLAETLFSMAQADNLKMRVSLAQAVNNLPISVKLIDEICSTSDLPTFSQKLLQLVRDVHCLQLMQS